MRGSLKLIAKSNSGPFKKPQKYEKVHFVIRDQLISRDLTLNLSDPEKVEGRCGSVSSVNYDPR